MILTEGGGSAVQYQPFTPLNSFTIPVGVDTIYPLSFNKTVYKIGICSVTRLELVVKVSNANNQLRLNLQLQAKRNREGAKGRKMVKIRGT